MPADSAALIGLMNEVAETTVVAMPGELAVTAALRDDSMGGTVGWGGSGPGQGGGGGPGGGAGGGRAGWVDSAPVQCGVGMPRMAAASAKPYWVGVKNELSVT